MTSLRLDARAHAALSESLMVLARPFDHADTETWRLHALDALKPLVGAARGIIMIGSDSIPLVTRDYDRSALDAYADHYAALDLGLQRSSARTDPVWTRRQLFEDDLDTLHGSECYNDYLHPNGILDSMGITLATPRGRAAILLHRDRFGTRFFGERGLGLLRIVAPAFESALTFIHDLRERRSDLARTIDLYPTPLALYDATAAVLHRNTAYNRLGAILGEPMHTAVQVIAAAVARWIRDPSGPPMPSSTRLNLGHTTCEAHVILLDVGAASPNTFVVRMQPINSLPVPQDLGRRFGLTEREAAVALLLAERATNGDIARALGISERTARAHTGNVLFKVGARSRREVASRIRSRAV